MLLTKEVEVKLTPNNIEHYENLGYEIPRSLSARGRFRVPRGTMIIVRVEDLPPSSSVMVDVLCDNCRTTISHTPYHAYKKYNRDGAYFCIHCANVRREQTCKDKYGCINVFQHPDVKSKSKETSMQKYGTEYACQSEEIKDKIRQISLHKYGTEWPIMSSVVREKIMESFYLHGTQPTSSQQFCIYNMLKEYYGDDYVKLNYPCGWYSLDVAILFDDIAVNVEYDGAFWHTNQDKDRKRDEFVKDYGYRILRIKSGTKIPNFADLVDKIESLRYGEHAYDEMVLPDWETTQNDYNDNQTDI